MFSFTRYGEQKILDCVFGGATLTPPATWYLAQMTDGNTKVQRDQATFTEVPSTNGYARLAITNNATNFPASAEGTVTVNGVSTICSVKLNGVDFEWANPTGSWGTPQYIGFFDAAVAGNMWGYLTLDNPWPVGASITPFLAAGAAQMGLD